MNRQQAITRTNGELVYWRIYVSLGLDELRHVQQPVIHLEDLEDLQLLWIIYS